MVIGVERVLIDPEFDRVMVVRNMDITSIIDRLIRKVKRRVEIVQQEIIHYKFHSGTVKKRISRSDAEENESTSGGNKEEKGTEKKEHVSSRKK